MWSALSAAFGSPRQPNGFEDWQYMGTFDGRHEFRHRNHAVHGRIVWTTAAHLDA